MWSEGRKKQLFQPPLFPVPLTAGENTDLSVQDRAPRMPPVPLGQPGQAAWTYRRFRASLEPCTMKNKTKGPPS